MKASPGTLISDVGSLGEAGMDDSTEEGVYDRDGRDGVSDDTEVELWRSRAWVSVWKAVGCEKKDE
jgi:hypothetical protein